MQGQTSPASRATAYMQLQIPSLQAERASNCELLLGPTLASVLQAGHPPVGASTLNRMASRICAEAGCSGLRSAWSGKGCGAATDSDLLESDKSSVELCKAREGFFCWCAGARAAAVTPADMTSGHAVLVKCLIQAELKQHSNMHTFDRSCALHLPALKAI